MEHFNNWRIGFIILYSIALLVRRVYSRKYNQKEIIHSVDNHIHNFIVIFVIFSAGPLTLIWAISHLLDFAQLNFSDPAHYAGLGIFVLGILLLIWTHRVLGQFFSPRVEFRSDHVLIKTGPYSKIRHPMYTTVVCFVLGGALITANWFYFAFQMIALCLLVFVRIPREEKALIEKFGRHYKDYVNRTKKLIPLLW